MHITTATDTFNLRVRRRVGGSDMKLYTLVRDFVRKEDGQDLIEYAMLVVLIAVGAVIAVQRVGDTINAVLWQAIAAASY